MVDFEIVKSEEVKYGNKNFIEVAVKKTNEGVKFVSVSKGWTPAEGQKRFKNGIGFPAEVLGEVVEALQKMKEAL